jgi:alanine dehydrogenase
MLTVGVIGKAAKKNEHRIPIHPGHFDRIPPNIASRVYFESGYGVPFGIGDERLAESFGGVWPRDRLLAECDVVLLPKPLPEDLLAMREGGILWGWPHCVQQFDTTQTAIDRKQTLIAWEAMFLWGASGTRDMHLFYRNNEMAGYCGVIQALELTGNDGFYGPEKSAVVLSFGSVSRGAVYALLGRGFADIHVYTQRPATLVHDRIMGCRYGRLVREEGGHRLIVISEDGRRRPLVEVLSEADVIVNGILQDTDDPLMFLQKGEVDKLRQESIIVDASCDEGMGFPFSIPTSFAEPMLRVAGINYYAVDHTPSYLWRSASWEISAVVVSYLETIMRGPEAWDANKTVRRAIEIRDGVVQNPKILSFQNRSPNYPHVVRRVGSNGDVSSADTNLTATQHNPG